MPSSPPRDGTLFVFDNPFRHWSQLPTLGTATRLGGKPCQSLRESRPLSRTHRHTFSKCSGYRASLPSLREKRWHAKKSRDGQGPVNKTTRDDISRRRVGRRKSIDIEGVCQHSHKRIGLAKKWIPRFRAWVQWPPVAPDPRGFTVSLCN